MRKLFLIMLAFVPLTLFAQEWSFGVDAGVSRNTLTSNAESILAKSQIGFTGGGFVNYTSKVGLVYGSGIYFNTGKGGSFYVYDIDNSQYLMKGVERIEASYSSFELPLNLGYRIKLGEKFSITPPDFDTFHPKITQLTDNQSKFEVPQNDSSNRGLSNWCFSVINSVLEYMFSFS